MVPWLGPWRRVGDEHHEPLVAARVSARRVVCVSVLWGASLAKAGAQDAAEPAPFCLPRLRGRRLRILRLASSRRLRRDVDQVRHGQQVRNEVVGPYDGRYPTSPEHLRGLFRFLGAQSRPELLQSLVLCLGARWGRRARHHRQVPSRAEQPGVMIMGKRELPRRRPHRSQTKHANRMLRDARRMLVHAAGCTFTWHCSASQAVMDPTWPEGLLSRVSVPRSLRRVLGRWVGEK